MDAPAGGRAHSLPQPGSDNIVGDLRVNILIFVNNKAAEEAAPN